ncbi:unnamed protein product [Ilex paraguariensis]|uniref:protein-ribulosamine 3-kinase n=1 Tax=Ilex paraguariensis TaxID=185542 RepID=A0ABC8QP38_9AQUA
MYLCSTPQINTWTSNWIQFYGEHRLGYQLKWAREQYGDSTIYERGQRLVKNMGPLFEDVLIEPCLLHGDLWSGNISSDKNGDPVILDPACYSYRSEKVLCCCVFLSQSNVVKATENACELYGTEAENDMSDATRESCWLGTCHVGLKDRHD